MTKAKTQTRIPKIRNKNPKTKRIIIVWLSMSVQEPVFFVLSALTLLLLLPTHSKARTRKVIAGKRNSVVVTRSPQMFKSSFLQNRTGMTADPFTSFFVSSSRIFVLHRLHRFFPVKPVGNCSTVNKLYRSQLYSKPCTVTADSE